MKNEQPVFQGIAILVGTIIGAGVLGIPYAIYQTGFLSGVILMVVVALAVLLVNLQFGEIILSTPSSHQLTGYAEKYLGKIGKYVTFIPVLLGFYGALLVYLIGEGQVLAALAGGNPMVYSLIFFVFGSSLLYLGLNVIKEIELILTSLLILVIFLIAWLSFGNLHLANLQTFDLSKILFPYGVIFFSMGGLSAMPALRQVLKGREKEVKKSIIIGTLIPLAVYILFTFIALGVSGVHITEVATVGLGKILGRPMLVFGNLFAFFAMATGFLTLGFALKSTFQLDFNFSAKKSWLLTVSLPLVLLIFGITSFTKVMSVAGSLAGGIEGIIIGIIFLKLRSQAKRVPEYQLSKNPLIVVLLSLLFIGGIAYTLWFL
ncbi:MAG: aromatic amino acid transport family protein [Patescibacteria group bacterium]|jgi:tyrosine-specific transport protein